MFNSYVSLPEGSSIHSPTKIGTEKWKGPIGEFWDKGQRDWNLLPTPTNEDESPRIGSQNGENCWNLALVRDVGIISHERGWTSMGNRGYNIYIYRIVYNNIYIWLYSFFKAMSLSSRCASQSISFWAVPMWPVARSRNWFWSKEARSPFHRSAMLGGSTACRSPGSIAIKGHTISYNVRR